jgi:hypothetical protein
MAKRKTKPRPTPAAFRETRVADAVTIGWMLSVLTTLVCQLGAVAGQLYVRANPDVVPVALMTGMLVMAAVAIGSLSLLLTVMVYRLRRVPPPTSITVLAVVIAAMPIVALLVRRLWLW